MTSHPHVTEPEPLADLLLATAQQDRRAFARLYEMTRAKLFGVILRILKRRDEAEEVLQEVYLRIWRHAADYRPEKGLPMAWMASIARYRALDWYRRARGAVPTAELSADEAGPEAAPDPLDWAIAGAEARALKACLDELDAEQRDCIVLAYFDGYTHQELAGRLERPVGTVKSWIRRGLLRLRTCIER